MKSLSNGSIETDNSLFRLAWGQQWFPVAIPVASSEWRFRLPGVGKVTTLKLRSTCNRNITETEKTKTCHNKLGTYKRIFFSPKPTHTQYHEQPNKWPKDITLNATVEILHLCSTYRSCADILWVTKTGLEKDKPKQKLYQQRHS